MIETGVIGMVIGTMRVFRSIIINYNSGVDAKRGYMVEGNVRAILRDTGINESEVLKRANQPEDLFRGKAVVLSSADYYRLWNSVLETAAVPAFPIVVAQALAAESFSPLLFASLCSPDLSTAAGRISRFKPLISPIVLDIVDEGANFTLTYRWPDDEPSPPATLELAELAFIVSLARLGTRERIVPVRATAPDIGPVTSEYEDYFGMPIEEGPAVSLSFSEMDSKRPFVTANEQMWDMFAPEFSRRLEDLTGSATTTERVSAVLLEFLPSGRATIEAVSGKLIMSKRTLQRMLQAEGTSFQEVLKDVRKDLSVHYLTESNLTATEISYLLGFEDSNSFFRAFSSWTGRTPNMVRGSSSMTA